MRGIGGATKSRLVREMGSKMEIELICLQETKSKEISNQKVLSLWKHDNVCFEQAPAEGLSGGLLICWDGSTFVLENSIIHRRRIAIWGTHCRSQSRILVINIYAPRKESEQEVWKEIVQVINRIKIRWCLVGDFNTVVRY